MSDQIFDTLNRILPFEVSKAALVSDGLSLVAIVIVLYMLLSVVRRSIFLFKWAIIIGVLLAVIGAADEAHRNTRNPIGARGVSWWSNRGSGQDYSQQTAQDWQAVAASAMDWVGKRIDDSPVGGTGRSAGGNKVKKDQSAAWSTARQVVMTSTKYAGRGGGTVLGLVARMLA